MSLRVGLCVGGPMCARLLVVGCSGNNIENRFRPLVDTIFSLNVLRRRMMTDAACKQQGNKRADVD